MIERDTSKDLILEDFIYWDGAVCDGTTLWILDSTNEKLIAFNAATLVRHFAHDMTGYYDGGVSNGMTLWLISNADNKAYAYNANARVRTPLRDITFGEGKGESATEPRCGSLIMKLTTRGPTTPQRETETQTKISILVQEPGRVGPVMAPRCGSWVIITILPKPLTRQHKSETQKKTSPWEQEIGEGEPI